MSETENSILKTIACYEALGQYPLTAVEIFRYLQKESALQKPPGFLEVISLLKKSQNLGKNLENHNGLFFFKGSEDLYKKRICRYKVSALKWRKIRRLGIFLGLVPFFRGAAINGSLALDNARPGSDIDFLVFAKKGRIWACRMFLGVFLQILGRRRHGNIIADKICLNHYVAGPSLLVPIQNAPNAQLYCRLVPFISYADYQLFQEQNLSWLGDFIFTPAAEKEGHQRRIKEGGTAFRAARLLGLLFESILELAGLGILEKALGRWQKRRIMQKISRRPIGQDELLLNDSMLVFHYPICKNREAVRAYTERINSTFV